MGKPGWIIIFAVAAGAIGLQALEALLFIRGLKITGRWAVAVWAAFAVANLALPYVAWLIVGARQPGTLAADLIVRPSYAWFFNWLFFLLFIAPLIGVVRLADIWLHLDTLFRVFRVIVIGATAAGAVLSVIGLVNNFRDPDVVRVEVPINKLDPQLDGLMIAHLSDPHVAWWNSRAEIETIGRLIAEQKPDLLVITGDMVDHNPDYVHVLADALEDVRPRLGRFAIIGNHDVYTGREEVARLMEERGFRMLRSGCVSLADRGAALSLAGYDDSGKSWTSGDPAANKIPAAAAACPRDQPLILLAHRPPRFAKILNSPVDLALAGHTHGGQFRLPFGGPGLADLTFEHSEGLHTNDGKSLYITRGTGTVGWPFRLFCPAQISLIILRAN